ncbi:MAG: SDR family NAD(P)-dependent oxidoreductase [Actinobacteria bacterium]|nr:SDR family NAD(P)-dependent oxidoreductase [Actinomycetota bacterium]
MNPQQLHARYGPSALVTGASSGIGREIALQLAEAGFDLVLVARREAVLRELATELAARLTIDVQVLPIDLAHSAGVDELAVATTDLDIGLYVAAAGFGTSGPFLDSALEQEREMLRLNCEAVLTMSLLFGQRLAARRRGGLILMSSIVGFQGTPNAAHYAATKAYVQTLAEGLSVELRPLGVAVLAAAPGPTRSGFAARADMRMGRALSPAVVARGTLSALGRRPTVAPGLLSRVLKGSLAPLPRRARVRIMGTVMAQMTEHQRVEPSP